MNIGLSYLYVIILGILFSLFSELIISRKQYVFKNSKDIGIQFLKLIFTNLYVYSLLVITFIFQIIGVSNVKQITSSFIGNVLLFLFLFILISLLECIGGKISYSYYKKQNWNYKPRMIPFCNGYVSVVSSLYFTFFLYFYIRFIFPLLFS